MRLPKPSGLDVTGSVLRAGRSLRPLRDPGIRSGVVLVVLAAAGFVLFGLAWRGAARTIYVPYQVPWVISAGIVGAAVIGGSLAALTIHLSRRQAAVERAVVDNLVRTALAVVDDVASGRQQLPGRRR